MLTEIMSTAKEMSKIIINAEYLLSKLLMSDQTNLLSQKIMQYLSKTHLRILSNRYDEIMEEHLYIERNRRPIKSSTDIFTIQKENLNFRLNLI